MGYKFCLITLCIHVFHQLWIWLPPFAIHGSRSLLPHPQILPHLLYLGFVEFLVWGIPWNSEMTFRSMPGPWVQPSLNFSPSPASICIGLLSAFFTLFASSWWELHIPLRCKLFVGRIESLIPSDSPSPYLFFIFLLWPLHLARC